MYKEKLKNKSAIFLENISFFILPLILFGIGHVSIDFDRFTVMIMFIVVWGIYSAASNMRKKIKTESETDLNQFRCWWLYRPIIIFSSLAFYLLVLRKIKDMFLYFGIAIGFLRLQSLGVFHH